MTESFFEQMTEMSQRKKPRSGFTGQIGILHLHMKFFAGTLLLASRNGDDGILWCINRDMFAFERLLKETHVSTVRYD